jgi:hypothetical protein
MTMPTYERGHATELSKAASDAPKRFFPELGENLL